MAPLLGDKCQVKATFGICYVCSGTLRMEWLNISIAGNGVMRKMPIQLLKFRIFKNKAFLEWTL